MRAGLRRPGAALLAFVLNGLALAQDIPVSTPRLPPRHDGAAPAPPAAAAARPAAQTGAAPASAYTPQSAYAQPAYGQANAGTSPLAPQAAIVPQRAAAGACRVQPAPDRQSLTLVSGPDALARSHVPLGEFRAQQVVHSVDGRWAVAFTKLRGAPQFAALSIDLERCEVQRVVELAAAGEDARFEGDEAVLRVAGAEQRIGLRDGRVR